VRRAWLEFSTLYWGSGLCDDVPALAWFLLVSLVPLTLGLTALAALLLGDYARAQELVEHAARVLPQDVHDQLVQLILRTHHNSSLLLAGSVVAMVWVSSGAVGVIERCMARLLGRPRRGPFAGKLRNLALACGLACLIVVLVLAASAGTGLVDRLGAGSTAIRVAAPLVSLVVVVGVCALLYRASGAESLSTRAALAGGLAGAPFLLIMPTVVGYYLRLAASRTPEGVFLVLAGVIFTCYLVALGLLIGVGVSARVELGRPLAETA
jgi:uncharacterized BrkB/YihY/UPF0761 family membrane protein